MSRAAPQIRTHRKLLRVHGTLAQEIGADIVSGVLNPGEVLDNEVEASSRLGVSRNTYREAMRILAAKGLISSRTRTGTRVCDVAEWNLLDPDVLSWMFSRVPRPELIHGVFELRSVVEPAAAALSARRRKQRHLDQMRTALDAMSRHTLQTPEGREADGSFHAALLQSTGNPFIISLTKGVTAAVDALTHFKLRLTKVVRDPVPDHELVYDAIAAKDPEAARDAMLKLIRLAILDMPKDQRPAL
ncbi:MAG TPA: FadR/GntR family transcriptional regulator [Steroidobacteraceae bacterium]|jgi:DNA-binding FadR family transcriptional regulator|nr:FadR/GntR family transcriptional regulator [Steroidobacteraceae bacterium]